MFVVTLYCLDVDLHCLSAFLILHYFYLIFSLIDYFPLILPLYFPYYLQNLAIIFTSDFMHQLYYCKCTTRDGHWQLVYTV